MFKSILEFYLTGFRNMKLGRTLWLIIFVKLFIMFFVIKMLFFSENMSKKFKTDAEKTNFVYENLIKSKE